MLSLGFLLSIDPQANTVVPVVDWRDRLMDLFFENLSPEGRNNLPGGTTHEHGEIVEVRYKNFKHGNFNIRALPNTVKIIWLTSCAQTFEIDTRCLPRRLRSISLSINYIHGRIDLTTLPPNLSLAFLWENRMSGPIDFTKLPSKLTELSLHRNRIHQRTIWYDNLPPGLRMINLHSQRRGKGIREIRSVDSEMKVAKKDIFKGIPEKNVH